MNIASSFITKLITKEATLIIVTIGILFYLFMVSKWFKIFRLAITLPGPVPLPIVGNAYIVTNNRVWYDLGTNAYKYYGPLIRGWLSFLPVFFVLEPKDLQKILGTHHNTEKSFFYSLLHNFLGKGLITSSGDVWRLHRKLIQPVFHKNILESFIEVFNNNSVSLINDINKTVKINTDVNIAPLVNKIVLNVLNQAVLGLDKEISENGHKSPFREGKVLAQERIKHPWLLIDTIFKFTDSAKEELDQMKKLNMFARKILNEKRKQILNGKPQQTSLLEKFIAIGTEHPEFTDEDIISEICTFMLAGQDSVSAGIAFSLYYLAKHEDIQEKVFHEITEILDDCNDQISMVSLKRMTYLEQCIKEAMRLCPSVPMLSRQLTEDVTICNKTLPSGTIVFLSPFATHRMEHIYPDPLKYDPDRFSCEETSKRHPFAYLPFSAGPRNCIGYKFALLEMKTIISSILRNYRLSVKPGYKLELAFRITLRARGGIWLRFHPR